eukprot:451755-Pyramimonas_sp.AAC.1
MSTPITPPRAQATKRCQIRRLYKLVAERRPRTYTRKLGPGQKPRLRRSPGRVKNQTGCRNQEGPSCQRPPPSSERRPSAR